MIVFDNYFLAVKGLGFSVLAARGPDPTPQITHVLNANLEV